VSRRATPRVTIRLTIRNTPRLAARAADRRADRGARAPGVVILTATTRLRLSVGWGRMPWVRLCLTPDGDRWLSRPVDDAGSPAGPASDWPAAADAPGEIGARVVWADTASCYPRLRAGGVRVARCHDVALTEALLLGHEGRWRQPRSLAAAWARLTGTPVPDDPAEPEPDTGTQGSLFAPGELPATSSAAGPDGPAELDRLVAVHADQQARIAAARDAVPGFALLVAVESASALAAVELTEVGLPWRADVHDRLLEEALGPRPWHGGRPARLQQLAQELADLLDEPRLNPDSQPELLRVLRRNGIAVTSTRRHELRRIDHPVIEPLLRYRELSRLHSANGWAWREQWVHGGRFRPEYVPAGVVSGRWATRGGGALQIPRAVRAAVVADPGRVLVAADAGQLEPRVLAAMSRDPGLIAATRQGDLYAALASQALGRPDARAEAKLGMLSAMYGGGAGSPALAALRRRFPAALELLEAAARTGEDGGSVRSVLGRASPPPSPGWLERQGPDAMAARARAYGRFTRNFVIQASAADWASVLVAGLRTRLHELSAAAGASGPDGAHLVFFQHDEVLVEAPERLAEQVVQAVAQSGAEATRLVLGEAGVQVPLAARAVRSYADKE
jgi:DNA polymerase-1